MTRREMIEEVSEADEAIESALAHALHRTQMPTMRTEFLKELARLGFHVMRTDPAKGGRTTAERLSPVQRSERARAAANARWAKPRGHT
jgi:hypothetical protein